MRIEYFRVDGGGGEAGQASSPPPQVLAQLTPYSRRRPKAGERRDSPRRAEERGVLSILAGILDAPYSFVQEKGWGLVERLRRRSLEEKRKGDTAEAFLYAIGASTAAFLTGVGAGITGLVSPRAWKETIHAVTRPRETLRALASDPLSWPYLVGSIVGPGKAAKAVAKVPLRPAVYEADLARLQGRGVILGKVSEGGQHRWIAAIELEAPAVRAKGKPPGPAERYFTVSTPRGWAEVAEASSGRGVMRVRVERLREGKTIRVAEEWRLEGNRFRGRILVADPELALLERRAEASRGAVDTVARLLGETEPPRVAMRSRGPAALGAAIGMGLGLGVGEGGDISGAVVWGQRARDAAGLIGGPASQSFYGLLNGSSTPRQSWGRRRARHRVVEGPPSGSERKRGRREERRYSEILYPAPALPL